MFKIPNPKTLHRWKQRFTQLERLLAKRNKLDRRLEVIAQELGLSGAATLEQSPKNSQAKKNKAISRALKRHWAKRRAAEAALSQAQNGEASAAKSKAPSKSTAAHKARRPSMERHGAVRGKA